MAGSPSPPWSPWSPWPHVPRVPPGTVGLIQPTDPIVARYQSWLRKTGVSVTQQFNAQDISTRVNGQAIQTWGYNGALNGPIIRAKRATCPTPASTISCRRAPPSTSTGWHSATRTTKSPTSPNGPPPPVTPSNTTSPSPSLAPVATGGSGCSKTSFTALIPSSPRSANWPSGSTNAPARLPRPGIRFAACTENAGDSPLLRGNGVKTPKKW